MIKVQCETEESDYKDEAQHDKGLVLTRSLNPSDYNVNFHVTNRMYVVE